MRAKAAAIQYLPADPYDEVRCKAYDADYSTLKELDESLTEDWGALCAPRPPALPSCESLRVFDHTSEFPW